MKRIKGQSGFTLVEVILAVVILSVALTAMIQAMSSSLRALHYGSGYTKSLFVAEDQMNALIKQGVVAQTMLEEKEVEVDDDRYKIVIEAKKTGQIESAHLSLVQVRVQEATGQNKSPVTLETLLFTEASN